MSAHRQQVRNPADVDLVVRTHDPMGPRMILATVAEAYERFAEHPGWPTYEHHQAWLDIAVRDPRFDPREAAAAWGRRTVRWVQDRGLDRTLCVVDAATLLGDPTPDERWFFLEDDEPICHPRCTLCQAVARP